MVIAIRHSLLTLFLVSMYCVMPAPSWATTSSLGDLFQHIKNGVVFIQRSDGGSGSGYVFDSDTKWTWIVTARHVISGARHIDVVFNDEPGRKHPAVVLLSNKASDVAFLRVDIGGRQPLLADDVSHIREGQPVAILGYPRVVDWFMHFGDARRLTIHTGIISSVHAQGTIVQFDAVTDYGNSGGPIIDLESGKVLGIVHGWAAEGNEELPASGYGASILAIQDAIWRPKHVDSSVLQRVSSAPVIHPNFWNSDEGQALGMVLERIVLGGLIAMILLIVQAYVSWKLTSKAGYRGWWRFLTLLPLLNIIVLFVATFAKWPLERKVERLNISLRTQARFSEPRVDANLGLERIRARSLRARRSFCADPAQKPAKSGSERRTTL